MVFAVVENGGVANLVVSSSEFAASQGWVVPPNNVPVAIGWLYDGDTFSPPPELPIDLETRRTEAMREIVEHINEITSSALTAYPTVEVESWSIQKAEAEAVLADTGAATLSMAPFLTGVCEAQYGPASDTDRLAQVVEKAGDVKANADAWGAMASYVNGLRARTQLAIMAAEDVDAIKAALSAGIDEGNAFKAANDL